jgi:hypothetical protein
MTWNLAFSCTRFGTRYGGISTQAVSMARKRARVVFKAGEVDRLVDKVRAVG